MKTVAVIGGGPAGLMAAEVLSERGVLVDLYEAKPSIGRKFLVAGKGGLNLTHTEPLAAFEARYGSRVADIRPLLKEFGPSDVREWCHNLGIETFAGPSGRVFPKDMKALPALNRWMQRLRENGVRMRTRHRWLGWNADGSLLFSTPTGEFTTHPDATVLAVGGASWPKLGSDGKWMPTLQQKQIKVAGLKPSNCGFDVSWSPHFRERFAGEPLKSVVLKFTGINGETFSRAGSCMVTSNGLEGSLIYSASALIRDKISAQNSATISFDLAPDQSLDKLTQRLSMPQGSRSLSSHLRSKVKLKGVEAGLLREFAAAALNDPAHLASAIKNLEVPLIAPRPIEESISTAGGVCFDGLNACLMIESLPGLFCAGEMLDWEAPTGGYLLTACFASGRVAGQGAADWVERTDG